MLHLVRGGTPVAEDAEVSTAIAALRASDRKILETLYDNAQKFSSWQIVRNALRMRAVLHLAVTYEPFLSDLLEGEKKTYCRCMPTAAPPFRQVASGDLVLLKLFHGPIVGCFTVGESRYVDVDDGDYGMHAGTDCWPDSEKGRYATTLEVKDVRRLRAVPLRDIDRRRWVVLRVPTVTNYQQLTLI